LRTRIVLGFLASALLPACAQQSTSVFVAHLAIVNINPSHGAVGIGYDTDVNVTFSENVHAETVTAQTMCVTTADGASPCALAIPAVVSYDPALLTAKLEPNQPLLPDTQYTLHLTTGIAGDDGELPVEIAARFRTIPTTP
jgi:hypothetical protein